MPQSAAMKLMPMWTAVVALCQSFFVVSAFAQGSPSPSPSAAAKPSPAVQIEALAKKIDEQSAKIDVLSQQILKLQQELAEKRPGIIIGENQPAATPATATAADDSTAPAGGPSHTVARGETLTSIAKMYHVTVDELQKANHIDNPLKLQAGQTITIPTLATPTPSPGE
jgi:LysM repeat protein